MMSFFGKLPSCIRGEKVPQCTGFLKWPFCFYPEAHCRLRHCGSISLQRMRDFTPSMCMRIQITPPMSHPLRCFMTGTFPVRLVISSLPSFLTFGIWCLAIYKDETMYPCMKLCGSKLHVGRVEYFVTYSELHELVQNCVSCSRLHIV